MDQILTIAIPTLSRPDYLKDNLHKILETCEKLAINIYISDDSTDNDTQLMIEELQKKYTFISYSKNNPSLGHDKNILKTLKAPLTDYVWLVGDSLTIDHNELKGILEILQKKKYGIVSVNASLRNISYKTGIYKDPEEVFLKFCWHMTLTGATIYSRDCISSIDSEKSSQIKNFPHIFCIFRFLSMQSLFFWINKPIVRLNSKFDQNKGKSYWIKDALSVFLYDWKNAILALSDCYDIELCKRVIIRHSRMQRVFGFRSLLHMRRIGALNFEKFSQYKRDLVFHSGLNGYLIFLISITPSSLMNQLYKLYVLFK